ncbi:MAG: hypothetical protein CVU59_06530 [Deltaproteobacteria bacterium HGW-Deltaproteobacteria-17]|nr:MAG: hypothetical protein CVU59_06530 [Deltaproteobacteria bacterium HGW-Deltaproteobacteria-17]
MSIPFSQIAPEPKANAALLVADAVDRRRPDDATAGTLTKLVRNDAAAVVESTVPKHEKELTAEIDFRDRQRDAAYTATCLVTESYTVLPGDPARQEKAATLHNKLVPDTLAFLSGSMHTESTILAERMAYLESTEGAALVSALGLGEFVATLKETMAAFDAALAARVEKKEARPQNLYTAGARLDRSLRALYAYLVATESTDYARECFSDLLPLLASARAAATRRDKPTPVTPAQ